MTTPESANPSELFDRGLKLRREILGPEYVDNSLRNASNFMMVGAFETRE